MVKPSLSLKGTTSKGDTMSLNHNVTKSTSHSGAHSPDYYKNYLYWKNHPDLSPTLYNELTQISNNSTEQQERFSIPLSFGTGGLRGLLGAGTSRINVHTIERATKGVACYLKRHYSAPSCAIAYDSRHGSKELATTAAVTLASLGVKAYVFSQLMPTPILSFAVRALKCSGGIVITASHNPAQYNGYKVYDNTGCQITDTAALEVQSLIETQPYFTENKSTFNQLLEEGKIVWIEDWVINKYYQEVKSQGFLAKIPPVSVVYSPLHGTGGKHVSRILSEENVTLYMVKEQSKPNGDFPSVDYPNPEDKNALMLSANLLTQTNSDLALATDPDSDRIGAIIQHNGEPLFLTGNQVGILLFDYICKQRQKLGTMPNNPLAIKTIVTTPMADCIAKEYGVQLENVLTGFKYIGERISQLEKAGESNRFIFGFEESCGYLSGDYIRDKDGVSAALLITEMTAYYKKDNKTLQDVLIELYKQHGFYQSKLLTFSFPGLSGMATMNKIMDEIRQKPLPWGDKVSSVTDYQMDNTGLPKSNVMALSFKDIGDATIRPSGTEPKLKVYLSAKGSTQSSACKKIDWLSSHFNKWVYNTIK